MNSDTHEKERTTKKQYSLPRVPAKKPATWRSELSTYGGKWVKFQIALTRHSINCQAVYLNILAVYFKT